MNRAELKKLAKQQIKGNVGVMFLCTLITVILNVVLPGIGSFVLLPVVSFGLTLNYMAIASGQKATIGRLFEGFRSFGRIWCMNFLRGLFIFFWTLLFYIPGIVKSFAYSLAPFILADNPGMSATDAITESRRMTKGHKAEIFVLYLSFIPWFLLGAVTLGLAYIYIVPYMSATFVNYYHTLKGSPEQFDFASPEYVPDEQYPSPEAEPAFAAAPAEEPVYEAPCEVPFEDVPAEEPVSPEDDGAAE